MFVKESSSFPRPRFGAGELEAILLHPPVQRAAAQSERLGSLADVALVTLESFADQHGLYRFETEIFQSRLWARCVFRAKSAGWISPVRHIRMARSMVCSSSLTLPGQEYCINV